MNSSSLRPVAPFARRMAAIEASGVRRIFELAQKARLRGRSLGRFGVAKARRRGRLIDLSLGQPDFHAPPAAARAARRAVAEGADRYTVTQGMPELLAKLRSHLEHTRPVDGLLVTSGASGGLTLAILALVDAGDEVLIPDPYFVSYRQLVGLAGGAAVYVDTYADRFRVTPALLERHRTRRTKLLLFNNPVNPTGIAYTPAEVRAVADWAKRRGVIVVSDEIYDRFCFDFPFEPFARHHRRTVTIGGFSKTYGMPGWRLGHLTGPREWVERMTALQQYTFVCAPSVVQRAGLAALSTDMARWIDPYRRKRDLVYGTLSRVFEVERPQGAFYIFPKAPGGDAEGFVRRAIEAGVLVVPGGAFSRRGTHFRVSFAAPDAALKKAMGILTTKV